MKISLGMLSVAAISELRLHKIVRLRRIALFLMDSAGAGVLFHPVLSFSSRDLMNWLYISFRCFL